MHFRTWALCASALVFGFIAAGCQEGQPGSTQLAKLELQVDAASPYRPGHVPAGTDSPGTHQSAIVAPDPTAVRVSITGADFGELSQTVGFGATALTFMVPAGRSRTVTLVFLDGSGAILGTGQTVVDIAGATQVVNVTVTPGIPNANISTTTVQAANALQNKPFTVTSALVNNTNASLAVTTAGHRFRVQGSLADVSGAFNEAPTSFTVSPGTSVSYTTSVIASTLAAPGLYQIDGVVQGSSSLAGAFAIRTSFVPAVVRLIREHLARRIEGDGTQGFRDHAGATPSQWNNPIGIARCSKGIVVADKLNQRIRLIGSVKGSQITTTIMGNGTLTPSADGRPATVTAVAFPHGIAVDSKDTVFVTDTGTDRIRAFPLGGSVTTVANVLANRGFGGDGSPANDNSVQLNQPEDVLVMEGSSGETIFIADTGNHVIRRIDPVTTVITTIAGTPGSSGDTGDGGPANAARLTNPRALALDPTGNLLIGQDFADGAGGTRGLIRRVDLTTKLITTIAGSRDLNALGATFDADGGPAISTRLGVIGGIVTDPATGFIYFTEQGQVSGRVMVIDPEGNLRCVAGTGATLPGNVARPGTDVDLLGPQRLLLDNGEIFFPTASGNTIVGLK